MILGPVFEQFVSESPLSVMARATVEYALPASLLDSLFERTAERGYTRDLLFSTTVDLLSLVVCGRVPHVQSAFLRIRQRVPVSLKCVYEKLQRVETQVSAQMVRAVAGRCQGLVSELGGQCQALLPGYRVRVLDGNHLAATQKRLEVTRGHSAGPLPGQSLAVLDPSSMLISDVIPCEDADAQERALLGQVLPLVRQDDARVGDRNFCAVGFLCGLAQRRACFAIRRHGNLTVEPQNEFGPEFETQTGWVSGRRVWVCRDGQRALPARLVRVRLKRPTEDGDGEVEILTNLPARVKAAKVADLYLKRWKIEQFVKEMKGQLGMCQYKTKHFARVVGWVNLCVLSFCYLEWLRQGRLRQAGKKERPYWQAARAQTLRGWVRLQVERADALALLRAAQSARGRKRLNDLLNNGYDDPADPRGRRGCA